MVVSGPAGSVLFNKILQTEVLLLNNLLYFRYYFGLPNKAAVCKKIYSLYYYTFSH